MTVDLTKLILHTGYNSFKNRSIQRGNLILPANLNAYYTNVLTFTLQEPASFIQAYKYSSDYGDYFTHLDSKYHDAWRLVHTNQDDLLFSTTNTLHAFNILMKLEGSKVTFTLTANASAGKIISHPTGLVPITFVEYRLAN